MKPVTAPADRADPGLAPAHPHVRADLRLPPRPPGRRDVPRDGPRVGHPARRRLRRGLPAVGRRCRWSSSPAASWNYGVSTDVLGRLVEVISGQPLDEFFEQRIFAPLGMRDTSFGLRPDDDLDVAGPALPRHAGAARRSVVRDDVQRAVRRGRPLASRRSCPAAAGWSRPPVTTCASSSCCAAAAPTTAAGCSARGRSRTWSATTCPATRTWRRFGRPLFAETPLRGVGFGLGFSMVIDPTRYGVVASARRLQLGRRGVHGVLRRPGRGRDRQLLHAAAALEHAADPQLPARPGQPGPRRLTPRRSGS